MTSPGPAPLRAVAMLPPFGTEIVTPRAVWAQPKTMVAITRTHESKRNLRRVPIPVSLLCDYVQREHNTRRQSRTTLRQAGSVEVPVEVEELPAFEGVGDLHFDAFDRPEHETHD